jgi:hypothetical protein
MIVISKEDSNGQVASLLERYPNLRIIRQSDSQIDIKGKILINRNCEKISVYKEYGIEISVPLNSDKLPTVRETEHYIRNYPHIYSNKTLCLATDTDLYLHFREGFDLGAWMEEYVEVYYFSYEYYSRFGVFPFGERSHNELGILETYKDYFSTNDIVDAYKILNFICSSPYRGHYPCPCGSNLRLRKCHGEKIILAYKNENVMAQIKKDYRIIDKYVRELVKKHEEQTK